MRNSSALNRVLVIACNHFRGLFKPNAIGLLIWNTGMMEYWNDGKINDKPQNRRMTNIEGTPFSFYGSSSYFVVVFPSLHHSIIQYSSVPAFNRSAVRLFVLLRFVPIECVSRQLAIGGVNVHGECRGLISGPADR